MPTSISRRAALAGIAAGAAALAAPRRVGRRSERRRPSVLFIYCDDLRWDVFSHMNHPFLRTPNIDRLAHEGVRFSNAFVCVSLCSPSRACFMSGCVPQRTGVLGNDATDLDPRLPTYSSLLQQAGWRTGYVGKWHQESRSDPRPGFDYWLSFRGQGEYVDPTLNENGREFKQPGYMTDLLTDYAVGFLHDAGERPFCLTLSHKAVHGPFTPAPRHADALSDVRMAEPASWREDFANKPEWQRRMMARGTGRQEVERNRDRPVPERLEAPAWDPIAPGRLNYLRALLAVDESVGRVLDTLAELGRLDDTMVIFSSDNGFFLGEHRRGDKRLAYEESIRIPLLVRYPALAPAGAVAAPMALNLDVCPTILDLCGRDVPDGVMGTSLLPLLREPGAAPAGWRQDFLYQYFHEAGFPGIPNLQAVRTERYKLVRSPDYPGQLELYDLQADPHELDNLAGRPELAELQAQLSARLDALVAEAEATRLPPRVMEPKLLLDWDLSGDVPGAITGFAVGEVAGRRARRSDGTGRIVLARERSPRIHGGPFWVEVQVYVERDGAIVSQGGQTNGWQLATVDGKPRFSLSGSDQRASVTGSTDVRGRWVTLTGIHTAAGGLQVLVDGKLEAAATGAPHVGGHPQEPLTVGADEGTPVSSAPAPPFVGAIAALQIGAGERVI